MREILFKAKRKDNGKWVEGYYYKMSETTYCFKEDYERKPVSEHHYILQERMEVLEVSESYAYKLMKRLNRELQAMGCQTIAGKVDRKYFYEQFYGTRSNDGRN